MGRPRIRIAGMQIAVAFAALDWFLLVADFPGVILLGLALHLGYPLMRRARGRSHRFWIGFEATGLWVLLDYLACCQSGAVMEAVFPRMAASFLEIARILLPPGAFITLEDFVYFENSNPIVAQLVVFEVAFGIPMLLLAACGGWLARKSEWSGSGDTPRTGCLTHAEHEFNNRHP